MYIENDHSLLYGHLRILAGWFYFLYQPDQSFLLSKAGATELARDNCLRQELVNFFSNMPKCKYFRLWGLALSDSSIHFCSCSMEAVIDIFKQMWMAVFQSLWKLNLRFHIMFMCIKMFFSLMFFNLKYTAHCTKTGGRLYLPVGCQHLRLCV